MGKRAHHHTVSLIRQQRREWQRKQIAAVGLLQRKAHWFVLFQSSMDHSYWQLFLVTDVFFSRFSFKYFRNNIVVRNFAKASQQYHNNPLRSLLPKQASDVKCNLWSYTLSQMLFRGGRSNFLKGVELNLADWLFLMTVKYTVLFFLFFSRWCPFWKCFSQKQMLWQFQGEEWSVCR